MKITPVVQSARERPSPVGGVVQFRAGKINAVGGASGHEYLAIRQQGCGMVGALGVERVGRRPRPGGRVVHFGAGKIRATGAGARGGQYLAIRQQRRRVR